MSNSAVKYLCKTVVFTKVRKRGGKRKIKKVNKRKSVRTTGVSYVTQILIRDILSVNYSLVIS